ncbi:MAG: HlyD family efflux transporter periplasmic adaptor subunit [Xenococcus sp. (in: cyanobacteria)]
MNSKTAKIADNNKYSSQETNLSEAIDSNYGGMASTAVTVAQIPAAPIKVDTKNTSWSNSLQTLLEKPPATLPQRVITGGMVFCLVFGTWAWLGHIEEVGTAQGKLVPKGETYKIDALEAGKVTTILVEEGEAVKAGQVMVELDAELSRKEIERLEQMLSAYRLELEQKRALLERVSLEAQTRAAIAAAETLAQHSAIALAQQKVATNRQLLAQMHSKAAAYQVKQIESKPLSAMEQESIEQLRLEIAAHQQRIERLKNLAKEGVVSQEFVFQAEQAWRDSQQRFFQAQQRLREVQIRITQSQGEVASQQKETERLKAKLTQKKAEERRIELEIQQKIKQLELETTQIEAKIAETDNLLLSAKTKLKQKFFKAPVDGIVSSFDLQNPGIVIQAGQTIAEIAPKGMPLVLSAILPNREAGFVKKGMPVRIKFDAYAYQDYGVIAGKIVSISADAEANDKLGEIYRVKVELDRDYITENRQKIKFKAGQTATADIIIRRRRIIDVLLEPIRQLQKDGINL